VGKVKRKAKNLTDLELNYFQLRVRISIRNDSRDKIGCNISEVIAKVHSILEITFSDDLYCFTTEYLSMKNKREI
jgi:hypothetical protein